LNPLIYELGAAQEASGTNNVNNGFRDVISGDNSFNGVAGFAAGPGFDLSTDWGSIDAPNFVAAYEATATPAPTPIPGRLGLSSGRIGFLAVGEARAARACS